MSTIALLTLLIPAGTTLLMRLKCVLLAVSVEAIGTAVGAVVFLVVCIILTAVITCACVRSVLTTTAGRNRGLCLCVCVCVCVCLESN